MIFQDNEKRTNNEDQHFTLTFKGIMCTHRLEFTWCKKIPEDENWSLVANFQVSFYISPHHTFTRRSPPMFSHQIEFLATKNPRMHSNFRIQSEVNMGELVNVTTNRWLRGTWNTEANAGGGRIRGAVVWRCDQTAHFMTIPNGFGSDACCFLMNLHVYLATDDPITRTSSRSDKNELVFSSCMESGITKMFTDYPALQKPPISRVSSEK